MNPTTRELYRLLPYKFQENYTRYLNYVMDTFHNILLETIEDDDRSSETISRTIRELRETVEIVFLLKLLYGYVVNGYNNLDTVLSFLNQYGISGFTFGSRVFVSNVRMSTYEGDIIAGQKTTQSDNAPIDITNAFQQNEWENLVQTLIGIAQSLNMERLMSMSVEDTLRALLQV